MTFLFLGLKEDLGLNLSAANDHSSFLKCDISCSFLPYFSNSVFNFARSILLAVGTNFRPLDSNEISEAGRFLLERFITFLLTNLYPLILLLSVKLCYFLSKHYLLFQNFGDSLYYEIFHSYPPYLIL